MSITERIERSDAHADVLTDLRRRIEVLEALDARPTRGAAWRNLLDNGQFRVNQRGVTSQPAATNATMSDRWRFVNSGVGVTTLAVNTMTGFGVALPSGRPRPPLIQYVQMTTADAALGAADYMAIYQAIEGCNLQHLNFSMTSARQLYLSFDAYCTVAGTFIVELLTDSNRQISAAFVLPANEWRTITLIFPGDTAGNLIAYGNTTGMSVQWWLAAGSDYTGGAALNQGWATAAANTRAKGIGNTFPATNANIFAITNAQLEVDLLSPLEVRRFPDDRDICKRYCQTFDNGASASGVIGVGWAITTSSALAIAPLSPMRAAPTLESVTGVAADYRLADGAATTVLTALPTVSSNTTHAAVDLRATTAATLTAAKPYFFAFNGTAGSRIILSADI